jgi:hypothetical protein
VFGAAATWFPDVAARNYRDHGGNDLAFVRGLGIDADVTIRDDPRGAHSW